MRETADGTSRNGGSESKAPTAEDWARLHARLTDIRDHCEGLPKRERPAYLGTQAREICGLGVERLRAGGPFGGVTTSEAYAAEFLAAQLGPAAASEATKRAIEGRIRTRFLGFHPEVAALRRKLARYLGPRMPILLIGDRGTGKGVLARAAAKALGRAKLLTVPLSGVPEGLAESELFGHHKGAFTGAIKDRKGILLTASESGAMVYLDDVGECPAALQGKLLTALEEGIIRPVGSDEQVSIGSGLNRRFRLISSCQPSTLGNLRSDVRDRLSALPAWVPPLGHRGADILVLADRALVRIARELKAGRPTLSHGARVAMLRFGWPGNVRQLFSVVGRAIVLADGSDAVISRSQIGGLLEEETRLMPPDAGTVPESELTGALEDWPSLSEVEDRYIARVLAATGGRMGAAAQILGIHRGTLRRRLGP